MCSSDLTPADEAAVVALVKDAGRQGRRVKVVGSGHSWSDAAMTDGVLVELSKLVGVVEVDAQRRRVRVRAGTPLHVFNDALAGLGLALPIVGSVSAQTLGGLVATGTHGSSLRHGNLSTNIVGLRLVDGRGEVVVLEEGDPRLPGARVSLGALGIVTELTLRVDPAFTVAETTEPVSFEEGLTRLATLGEEAEYAKLWWLPHTGRAMLFRATRTDEPSNLSPLGRWVDANVLNAWVFPGVLGLGNLVPATIPALNALVAAAYFLPRRTVGRSDHVLSLAMPPRHRECEWAVPVANGTELCRRAEVLANEQKLKVNFICEARFVKADGNWMSPAHGQDVLQVGAYITNPRDATAWMGGFAAIARELGGRPHWGKHGVEGLTSADVAGMWPAVDRFSNLAKELDPDGIFRNAFVDRVVSR